MNRKACKSLKIIGLKELRVNTEKYIIAASKGESFMVVRRSKPVFILLPPEN
ncbi:MAG: antitoxin (DNA-binding transcriptional repressor) of toxin-antitoxin stability system [Candidatus Azotimanducaceae bacterium]|jgi:antitoxin (DNA-binding transcriptional repressor) of toxin-antitoxin stability system